MPGLVGETHTAFVKGRKIHDGALIACEMVHWLKTRKKTAAIIKLDFQKAYDRVRWSFVDIVLQKMGFCQRWRNWIKECVSTATMSVLVNGSPSKPFKMERGLRQGDPLFALLFVLVVDVLHRMLGEAVRNERIAPLLVGGDHIELSHLQFADDTILFCPPETETIMPKAVADKLIALQRSFMWCKEDSNCGIPLVKWEMVQTPKKAGGLGVGDAVLRNTALLFKWW
ncbi:uncharacterized protein LOC107627430 [Arachis ipaensis]|uniref:uncharacterized protein LOC107627430 n=1 Tax=Arachis ipaensis TaxID=130454 RepID=UPI0007AF2416|nr:uncharacterized protein LOC107627430 [Arachis ipaensis]XP_025636100.1 uncharacterized protein LOC112730218 [Arachis hypogaea]